MSGLASGSVATQRLAIRSLLPVAALFSRRSIVRAEAEDACGARDVRPDP